MFLAWSPCKHSLDLSHCDIERNIDAKSSTRVLRGCPLVEGRKAAFIPESARERTYRQTDRQRQSVRQAGRQTDSHTKTVRQSDIQTDRDTEQTDRQTDRQIDRDTEKTDRQTDRQTDR